MVGKKKSGAEIIDSDEVYNSRGLAIREEHFKLPPDPTIRFYRYCEIKPFISIVAITENNEVVFIEEFKYPVDEFVLSLPRGSVEKEETFLTAGERELQEEAGYTSKSFEDLGAFYPMAGTVNQEARVILARNSYPCNFKNTDEYERVSIRVVSLITFDDIFNLIRDGKLKDGLSLTPLMMTMAYLRK